MHRSGLLRAGRGWPALVALCALPALLEAVLTHPLGLPAQSLALQAGAPAPFGVFHDLRWIFVYASSWWQVGLWCAGALAARSLLTAAQMSAAWPPDQPAPPARRLLARSTSTTLVAAVLLTPAAAVQYGMGVAPLSFFFLAGVPVLLVLALLVHPGLVRPWWRSRPSWASASWVLLTFLYLSAAGACLVWVTGWGRVAAIAALAGAEALGWRRLLVALTRAREPRRLPLAPVGLAALVGLVVLTVTLAVGGHDATAGTSGVGPTARPGTTAVLEVTGFGDGWHGRSSLSLGGGFSVVRFSYLGSEADGAPLYYRDTDTYRALPELVGLLARQVEELRAVTGRPVVLVADSEGGLVAESYLLATPSPPVRQLVVASPLVGAMDVYYDPNAGSGPGLAGSTVVAALTRVLGRVSPLKLPADPALIATAESHAPAVHAEQFCPPSGVPEMAVFPIADALSTPYRGLDRVPVSVVAAFHGSALTSSRVDTAIRSFVRDGRADPSHSFSVMSEVAQALGMAWDAPPVAVSDVPAWRAEPPVTSCAAARAQLHRWLDPAARSPQPSGTISGAPSRAASAVRSSGFSWASRSASTRLR